jgi:hypothetical protein
MAGEVLENIKLYGMGAVSVFGILAAIVIANVWGDYFQLMSFYILGAVAALVVIGFAVIPLIQAALSSASGSGDSKAFQDLLIVILLTAAGILVLSIVACILCQQPRPREMFVDASSGIDDPLTQLQKGIAAAEVTVCTYITEADKYIKGDVGPKADKEPDLVAAAQQKAREGVNLVLCSDGAPAEVDSSGGDLTELDARLSRLESTLAGFTGVVFKHSYEETVPCKESFVDVSAPPTVEDLTARLTAVQKTIGYQQTRYLDPMNQKTKDLQAGKASDCDKKHGAKLAVSGGGPKARSS